MGKQSGPTAAAACRLSQFAVSLGPYVSEETEQHTLALRLVNHGSRTCALAGYPRVRLLDRRGVIPFPIERGDQMITHRPPKSVLVHPDGSAFVILNKNTCVNPVASSVARTTTVITIGMLAVPSVAVLKVPRRVPFPWRVPDYCGKGQVGSTIAVSPFEPTVRDGLGG